MRVTRRPASFSYGMLGMLTFQKMSGAMRSLPATTCSTRARLTRAAVSQLGSWKVSRERAMEGMPMMGPSVAAETVPE